MSDHIDDLMEEVYESTSGRMTLAFVHSAGVEHLEIDTFVEAVKEFRNLVIAIEKHVVPRVKDRGTWYIADSGVRRREDGHWETYVSIQGEGPKSRTYEHTFKLLERAAKEAGLL